MKAPKKILRVQREKASSFPKKENADLRKTNLRKLLISQVDPKVHTSRVHKPHLKKWSTGTQSRKP
jgi:hypothetical protein